ncbi:hypothetical protein GOODEAATRI_007256, partial [Goodea atripinnis]
VSLTVSPCCYNSSPWVGKKCDRVVLCVAGLAVQFSTFLASTMMQQVVLEAVTHPVSKDRDILDLGQKDRVKGYSVVVQGGGYCGFRVASALWTAQRPNRCTDAKYAPHSFYTHTVTP